MDEFDKLFDIPIDITFSGEKGDKGDSAYQIWLLKGGKGSEIDFLKSLRGKDGLSIKGEPGKDGKDGVSIKGEKGDPGINGTNGKNGKNGKNGIDGKDGLSAYEIWLKENEGTEEDFFQSLKGKDGKDAQWAGNAYTELKELQDVAIANPANDEILIYNSTTRKWTNSTNPDPTPVTLSGEDYLTLTGQALTANPVNLSTTNVTGVLPETKGGTNQSTYTLGDTLYSSAINTLSKLAGNTTTTQKFYSQTGDGVNSAAPVWSDVQDIDVVFTDVTTNNTSITKHGYAPKLSNSATQFLNGEGNWTTPSGIANAYVAQAFSAVTTVTVTHNFGAYPVVQVIDNTGAVIVPLTTTNISVNAFTVTFTSSKTGTVLATVGSPQPATYTTVTDNYTLTSGDYYIECTASGKTMTLPTAVGRQGQAYSIDNSSSGDIDVTTTGGQTIHGNTTVTLPSNAVVTVVSNGSNWRIK